MRPNSRHSLRGTRLAPAAGARIEHHGQSRRASLLSARPDSDVSSFIELLKSDDRMRWGVDAQRLAGQRLGVGRYIEYLARHWDRAAEETDRVTLFVREPLADGALGLSSRFEVRTVGPRLSGQLWQNFVLPRYARGLDVLFCPSYSIPLNYRGKSVVAIHSMNEVETGAHPWWYKATYSQVYRLSAQQAARVIVPSESTRSDICRTYDITPEKIDVIPQGADESFQPVSDPTVRVATRRALFGEDAPYLVFVGKLSQRRNIPVLIEGFALAKRRIGIPHKLLLFGPNHLGLPLADIASRFGVAKDVVQTDGRVRHHEELVNVYGAADAYISASSYEGFSMTLVEALSCGTPVIGVNRAAVAEIAGGCAVLIDEPSAELLAKAIERVVTDASLRDSLRAASLERAKSFRWDRTAGETLNVLRRVAEQ